jgi:hypothetical protein
MELFWSKDDIIKRKIEKIPSKVYKSRSIFLAKFNLILSTISLICVLVGSIQYIYKQSDLDYRVSYMDGKIEKHINKR